MMPIKDNKGKVTAYMNIASEVTAIVSVQKRFEKINSYQASEVGNITQALKRRTRKRCAEIRIYYSISC